MPAFQSLLSVSFAALAAALPNPQAPAAPAASAAAGIATLAAAAAAAPPAPANNTLIGRSPDACNGQGLSSQACEDAYGLNTWPGRANFFFEADAMCTDQQVLMLQKDFGGVMELATGIAEQFPNAKANNHDALEHYFGRDWPGFEQRIGNVVNRLAEFFHHPSVADSVVVIVTCRDAGKRCGDPKRPVGAYTSKESESKRLRTYKVNFCNKYFDPKNVDFDQRREDAAQWSRDPDKGYVIRNVKRFVTRAQYLYHEFTHMSYVNGPPGVNIDPPIKDQLLGRNKVYGAEAVRRLALVAPGNGGGADVASQNADSYAWAGSAIYWQTKTGVLPRVIGTQPRARDDNQDDADDTEEELVMVHMESPVASVSDADYNAMVNGDYDSLNDESVPADNSQPPAPAPTPAPAPAPAAADQCGTWYDFWFDDFQIFGKDFDKNKLGDYGSGLLSQLRGCGDVTDWKFDYISNDPHGYQWKSTGKLPMGTKYCVGRAVVSAGGANADGCAGAG